jgi:transcriptional regulator with XRE-family HTH domain
MAENTLIALGRAIRQLRAEQNIGTDELADTAGLTPGRLHAIEAGRFDPAYDELRALSGGLRVTPAELVGRADAKAKDGDA